MLSRVAGARSEEFSALVLEARFLDA